MDICLPQGSGEKGNTSKSIQVKLFYKMHANEMLFLQSSLTEGLSLAKDFHSNVQELLNKMNKCEDSFGHLSPPSFVLESVCTQLEKHKVCFFFI